MSTTTVRERPIISSAEMVRAILAGRKTRIMRIIKLNSELRKRHGDLSKAWVDPGGVLWGPGPYMKVPCSTDVDGSDDGGTVQRLHCPYGYPEYGDRLWVRETFFYEWPDENPPDDMRKCRIVYRADDESYPAYSERDGHRWSPPIHMPRWASRITLEITDVAVQRVQEITNEQAEAEGVDAIPSAPAALSHRTAFAGLWNKINGPDAWDRNDWCWAVAFKTVEVHNAGWILQ